MSATKKCPGIQTDQERQLAQSEEVEGVRYARFGDQGPVGFSFDGEAPSPDGAADAENDADADDERTDGNPDQPREPAGSPGGGQFASGGGGGGGGGSGSKGGSGPPDRSGDYPSLVAKLKDPVLVAAGQAGFTYSPLTGEQPKEGFSLSMSKVQTTFDAASLTEEDLAHYAVANWDALSEEGAHFGGWSNPSDGKVYLDISHVVKTEDEAWSLGQKHEQLAYFDLKNGKTVDIGDSVGGKYVPKKRP